MKPLNLDDVRDFVNRNIVIFHEKQINSLEVLSLETLLKKKNPYLFRAKNVTVASELIREILDAFLSSSDQLSQRLLENRRSKFLVFDWRE